MYPFLPLSEIDLDAELARRLSRHLAYFHLALPVAEDENGLTVALAKPDNRAALQVIETALGCPIVPVRSTDTDIRAALDRIWQDVDTSHGGVIAWAEDPADRDALAAFIRRTVTPAFPQIAVQISSAESIRELTDSARELRSELVIAHSAAPASRRALLLTAPSAIWLTRDLEQVTHRRLAVLRLNTPDRQLLDWIPPLNSIQPAENVILASAQQAATPSGNPLFSRISALLSPDDPRGAHIAELRLALTGLGVQGRLKVREGSLGEVILDETSDSFYGLLVMAAEASGSFAAEVFEQIWERIGGALLIKAG